VGGEITAVSLAHRHPRSRVHLHEPGAGDARDHHPAPALPPPTKSNSARSNPICSETGWYQYDVVRPLYAIAHARYPKEHTRYRHAPAA